MCPNLTQAYNAQRSGEIMTKLYFKKILVTFGFIANYFLLVFIIAFVWNLVLRNTFSELVSTLIHAILALVLNFVIVCIMRYKSLYNKMDALNNQSFFNILKSRDNIIHTLAFISMLLPFLVSIAIVENTPLLPLVVGTILLLFANSLIFLLVNALIWSIAYKLFMYKNTSKI